MDSISALLITPLHPSPFSNITYHSREAANQFFDHLRQANHKLLDSPFTLLKTETSSSHAFFNCASTLIFKDNDINNLQLLWQEASEGYGGGGILEESHGLVQVKIWQECGNPSVKNQLNVLIRLVTNILIPPSHEGLIDDWSRINQDMRVKEYRLATVGSTKDLNGKKRSLGVDGNGIDGDGNGNGNGSSKTVSGHVPLRLNVGVAVTGLQRAKSSEAMSSHGKLKTLQIPEHKRSGSLLPYGPRSAPMAGTSFSGPNSLPAARSLSEQQQATPARRHHSDQSLSSPDLSIDSLLPIHPTLSGSSTSSAAHSSDAPTIFSRTHSPTPSLSPPSLSPPTSSSIHGNSGSSNIDFSLKSVFEDDDDDQQQQEEEIEVDSARNRSHSKPKLGSKFVTWVKSRAGSKPSSSSPTGAGAAHNKTPSTSGSSIKPSKRRSPPVQSMNPPPKTLKLSSSSIALRNRDNNKSSPSSSNKTSEESFRSSEDNYPSPVKHVKSSPNLRAHHNQNQNPRSSNELIPPTPPLPYDHSPESLSVSRQSEGRSRRLKPSSGLNIELAGLQSPPASATEQHFTLRRIKSKITNRTSD